MSLLHGFGDFLLSTWLWNVTFDWFHPLFSGAIMFFMLRIIMRKKRLPSLMISLGAQLSSLIFLHVIVAYGLIGVLNWQYEPLNAYYALAILNILAASLSVGIVYAILQSIYFLLGRLIWDYTIFAYLIIAWISNGIGMLLSYFFIRLVIIWHYTA